MGPSTTALALLTPARHEELGVDTHGCAKEVEKTWADMLSVHCITSTINGVAFAFQDRAERKQRQKSGKDVI